MFAKLHLPHVKFTPETYFVLSMLHDLGTADHLITSTVLSFEYSGGIAARSLLLSLSAPEPQADSVAEAIIRHQDIGPEGEVAALTGVVHLATLFDNTGKFADKLHKQSVDDVVAHYPRLKWSGCFKAVLEVEVGAKPWCHTTFIGIKNFKGMIDGNDLGKPYEK
jgi:cyanamide hydratase